MRRFSTVAASGAAVSFPVGGAAGAIPWLPVHGSAPRVLDPGATRPEPIEIRCLAVARANSRRPDGRNPGCLRRAAARPEIA